MIKTFIYGDPHGFDFYEKDVYLNDYFKGFYISSRRGRRLVVNRRENGETIFFCSDCISNHKNIHWCKTCGEPFLDKSLPKGKLYECKDCRGKINGKNSKSK